MGFKTSPSFMGRSGWVVIVHAAQAETHFLISTCSEIRISFASVAVFFHRTHCSQVSKELFLLITLKMGECFRNDTTKCKAVKQKKATSDRIMTII